MESQVQFPQTGGLGAESCGQSFTGLLGESTVTQSEEEIRQEIIGNVLSCKNNNNTVSDNWGVFDDFIYFFGGVGFVEFFVTSVISIIILVAACFVVFDVNIMFLSWLYK